MANNRDANKTAQLGMRIGTAQRRLRKRIMFLYIQKAGDDVCFQCGKLIDNIDDLSVEHKISWMHSENPIELYNDLDNIAFSHRRCNVRRQPPVPEHGTLNRYSHSTFPCSCDECRKAKNLYIREYREKNLEAVKGYERKSRAKKRAKARSLAPNLQSKADRESRFSADNLP